MTGLMIVHRVTTGVYVFVNEQLSWIKALEAAQAATGTKPTGVLAPGQLLTISQAAEQSIVSNWLLGLYEAGGSWGEAADGGGIPYIWLGASDLINEGQWQWANGESFDYTNWGTGKLWSGSGQSSEPDDFQGQDALAIGLAAWPKGFADGNGLGSAGQWNDIDENNLLPYVIEFSADTLRINVGESHYAFDVDDHAGQVAKTLGAVFGKESVTNKAYAGIGLHFVDELNYNYSELMLLAIEARLGANPSHAQVVDLLYTNVVGQSPDDVAPKTFTDLLDSGTFTVGGLGVMAADTDFNKTNINLMGLAQTGLEYLPFGS